MVGHRGSLLDDGDKKKEVGEMRRRGPGLVAIWVEEGGLVTLFLDLPWNNPRGSGMESGDPER